MSTCSNSGEEATMRTGSRIRQFVLAKNSLHGRAGFSLEVTRRGAGMPLTTRVRKFIRDFARVPLENMSTVFSNGPGEKFCYCFAGNVSTVTRLPVEAIAVFYGSFPSDDTLYPVERTQAEHPSSSTLGTTRDFSTFIHRYLVFELTGFQDKT